MGTNVSEGQVGEALDWRGRARAWMAGSAWTSLFWKGAVYLVGFAALAYVGSGGLSGLLSAASAPIASAAPPPGPSAHAAVLPASAAPSSTASAISSAHPAADAGAPGDAGAGGGGGAITADGKVILNLAGEEDLRRLPGIGPSKAKAILELRAKLGKFKRAEDLLRVKGLGRKKLARLRPLLLIDPPSS